MITLIFYIGGFISGVSSQESRFSSWTDPDGPPVAVSGCCTAYYTLHWPGSGVRSVAFSAFKPVECGS